jgi:hypothetical protein
MHMLVGLRRENSTSLDLLSCRWPQRGINSGQHLRASQRQTEVMTDNVRAEFALARFVEAQNMPLFSFAVEQDQRIDENIENGPDGSKVGAVHVFPFRLRWMAA